jgi:hypothetical protein
MTWWGRGYEMQKHIQAGKNVQPVGLHELIREADVRVPMPPEAVGG